ncbi:response regulator transcription factor [Streptomyces sp. S1A]|uniref:response regulator transcription factor n=1 Tax=Streptomyces sp. ICN903 TaxID=2964654 RepID=UPI001EDB381A|nr:response regulator transcription factor [Streptomyces sp. ICN903]MCG3041522.1 response regulator transcription factor [Streptomyces sp. ICN903]
MDDDTFRAPGRWPAHRPAPQHPPNPPAATPPPVRAGTEPVGAPAFPTPAAGPGEPLTVVVADDNPVVRAGLGVLLSGRDDLRVVAEAADGHQAYEAVTRHRPDVVLLDVRMPGVDGISILPYLARIAPVMMLTYSREAEIVHEALRLGAVGYLVHGEFTADQLVTAVRDIKDGRSHFTPTASSALLETLREGSAGGAGPLPDGLGTAFDHRGRPSTQPDTLSATAHGTHGETLQVTPQRPQNAYTRQESQERSTGNKSLLSQQGMGYASPAPGAGEVLDRLSQREVEVMDLIASGMTNQQIAATCFISQKTVKNHINRIFSKLNAGSRGEAIAIWHGVARGGSADRG